MFDVAPFGFLLLYQLLVCFCFVVVVVVQALYGSSTSGEGFNYVSYIYLLAPVSLGIINPIGFAFMEFQKQISSKSLNVRQVSRRGLGSVIVYVDIRQILKSTLGGNLSY